MEATWTERLRAVHELRDAARRGRELEALVAGVFRDQHFTVIVGARAAWPRQTDVLAVRAADRYLIECKWTTAPADIDAIDSLRSRLRRTSADVVGLLLSMNGFTPSVRADVEVHRQQPIVLLSGEEFRRATAGGQLVDVLWRKREALVRDGRVLLDEPLQRRRRRGVHAAARVQPAAELVDVSGAPLRHLETAGGFGAFAFTTDLPDIDWSSSGGFGVTLDIAPEIRDESDLLGIMETLTEHGWTTADGCWSFQQATLNWHGIGPAAFVAELPKWAERAASPHAHSNEELLYFDHCDNGFYTLTANLSAHRHRQARYTAISFQLSGIPLDTGPLHHLCRSLSVHDGLHFRPHAQRSVTRAWHQTLATGLDPLAFVVDVNSELERAERWAKGVVVVNPFRRVAGPPDTSAPSSIRADLNTDRVSLSEQIEQVEVSPPEADALPSGLELLRHSELLVCGLRDYHPLHAAYRQYNLGGYEFAASSNGLVCRFIADWDTPEDESPKDECGELVV